MPKLTADEALAWVIAEPRTAKLATIKQDGSPHVVPVWIDLDGEQLVFTTGGRSLKARAMRREPRVSMCFDDEAPPFAFVTIAGHASLSNDLDEMLEWATRIGGRYMGADRAEEYGRRNAVPEEYLVRVSPTRIVGATGVAD